jgi:hypothetical protein
MMHNNASLIAFFENPNLTKFQKTLGVHDFYFGDGDWPYPVGAIQMNGKSDAALVSFNAPKSEDPAELARQTLDFWITTEDLPLDENRVPGRPRRPHQPARYTPTNVEAHERLIAKFKGLLDVMHCRNQIQENRHYWGGRLGLSGGPPERHRPVRHRPGHLGLGPQLQDARARQPLRRRLELLRLQHRSEHHAHRRRDRPAGR